MKKILIIHAIAIAVIAMSSSGAYAGGDHFENGFKTELGAIAARASVGLGFGLVRGVVHGGHHPGYQGHDRGHSCGHSCGHQGHGNGPYYQKTVVYRPYPVPVRRVEHKVVYYGPGPRLYRPCD
jgi:hypothetical protein